MTIFQDKITNFKEIWIAGFPSYYGGADTELDHQVDLWRMNNVKVSLVPMFGCDEKMLKSVQNRGCQVCEYRDDIFKDKIVASWCNGEFLDKLPIIYEKGKPEKVIWFNCMTWLFDKEITAHKEGMIDVFGFVSEYQKNILVPYTIIACTNFVPIPGSDIWANPDDYNIKILNKNLDEYNFYFFGKNGENGENELKDIIKIKDRGLQEFNDESRLFKEYLKSTGKLNTG